MSEKTREIESKENARGSRAELVAKMREFRTAFLVTRDPLGLPRARPLAIARIEDDGTLWFATAAHSPKVAEILKDDRVAAILHRDDDDAWISLSGRATLVHDRKKLDDLWDASMKVWFSGPDDPAIVLLRVDAKHAEYYEPKSRVARAFEVAKGLLSDEAPNTGLVKHLRLDRLSEPGRLSDPGRSSRW